MRGSMAMSTEPQPGPQCEWGDPCALSFRLAHSVCLSEWDDHCCSTVSPNPNGPVTPQRGWEKEVGEGRKQPYPRVSCHPPGQERTSPRGPCDSQWPDPLSLPPQVPFSTLILEGSHPGPAPTSTPGQCSTSVAPPGTIPTTLVREGSGLEAEHC